MHKRILPVIALVLAALTGYYFFEKTGNSVGTAPALKSEPGKMPMSLPVYYIKYTDKDAYLVREVHAVPFSNDGPQAAVNELISGTPRTDGASRVLPANTRLLGINISPDGLATVNFSKEVLSANVGSSGEVLGIQSIVNTLAEFSQIKQVSFQVEGRVDSRARDWWGHVGLYNQPFTANNEKVFEPAIWLTHPLDNQTAGVPLLVKGSAMVPQGSVTARLLNEDGQKIAEKTLDGLLQAPARGNFEMSITFSPPGKGKGTLEVFPAGKDPSPQDIVKIPIQWP